MAIALVRSTALLNHNLPATRYAELPTPLPLRRGGVVERPVIAYEAWGELNVARDNTVLLFTGLSPSAHAASSPVDPKPGWWEHMIGAGKPIDTDRYFVICINSLGSPFGSSSPASIDPLTGERYGLSFPELSVEDIALGGREVLRTLGITRVACVMGSSLGGMVSVAYATLYPDAVDNLVSISGTAHASPFAIALRSLQREMVTSDPAWRGGHYPAGQGPTVGLRLARKLGTITYRSAEEWQQRFGRERMQSAEHLGGDFGPQFEVESYLEHQAHNFANVFDANAYLYLSRAMDEFDLAEHGDGSLSAAFARCKLRHALVIGVDSDMLFRIDEQREIATHLQATGCDVEFHEFQSIQGHDAFLSDRERFEPVIRAFMARLQG